MQLPVSLRTFDAPTLIAATDNVHAKLYFVSGRDVALVETISTKTEVMEHERNAVKLGTGAMSSAEPEDHRQQWSREQLYEKLNVDLRQRLARGEFEHLAFTVPHDVMNELKESLHIDLLKRVIAYVPKNIVGEEPIDVVAHVLEAM